MTRAVAEPASKSGTRRVACLVALVWVVAFGGGSSVRAQTATTSDDVRALSGMLPDLVAQVEHSVVQIFATRSGRPSGDPNQNQANQTVTGAGVIVDAQGYILTNHHVVEGARRVQVTLGDPRDTSASPGSILKPSGRKMGARVVGTDLETDLAVLKIDAEGLSALPFADSEAVRKGQLVFALGSPRGLSGSVSMGVVSAVARQFGDGSPMIYIQSDAAVNPGNSGGPLIDVTGSVVGINTFIVSDSGGSQGLSFAVPSNIARTVFDQIRSTGRVRRGVIGANPQTITPLLSEGLGLSRDWGVVLGDVYPGGPAAAAGLRPGDVVQTLNGKQMENARQFLVNLYPKPIGESVALEVLRDGRSFNVSVDVAERPDDPARFGDLVDPRRAEIERLGILGIDLNRELLAMFGGSIRSDRGVVVAAVLFSLSPTGEGLQPGDVVRSVNGNAVNDVGALRSRIDALSYGQAAVLQVERLGRLLYVAVQIDL